MNAETFLNQFGHLADAPNGVQKLRELVLQLAVRGRLTNDLRSYSGKTVLPPCNGQTVVLPDKWGAVEFGEVVTAIEAGWSPKCESRPKRDDEWGILKISSVSWNRFQPDENKALPSDEQPRPHLEVRTGDFLMSRANTAALVAKSVVVDDTPRRLLLCDKVLRVAFKASVDPRFANFVNNSPYARDYFARVATGTSESMRNVSREQIRTQPFPLPPLAEQHRIVAKVDELLALCDELETQQARRTVVRTAFATASLARLTAAPTPAETAGEWSRVAHHFDTLFAVPQTIPQLRQTILQLAVTGRLVPQISNELHGDSICEIVPASAPLDVPHTWRWTEFGEIGEIAGGFAFRSADYAQTGVFVLRVTNIEPTGVINQDDAVFLQEGKVTKAIERFYLNEGDILLVMVGGSLGKVGVVTSDVLPALLNQNLWRITPVNSNIDRQFLRLLIEFTVSFQRNITHSTHGHLSREEFRKKPVAIPPLGEQRRLVARVNELQSACDTLESQLTARQGTAERLTAAMVQGVLEGVGSAAQA